ncbi:MAG TPA: FAD-dependent oxidoreductase [Hyphomicrobiaceae bacterium]|nr:FAD-dependent oxidoreductase [Hyphomicrobiaceae bacterium]
MVPFLTGILHSMSKSDSFDAGVIGSGLGGLTAAALLAKSGLNVCVLERNASPGGAASVFEFGGLTNPRDPGGPKHQVLKKLGSSMRSNGCPSRRSEQAGPPHCSQHRDQQHRT